MHTSSDAEAQSNNFEAPVALGAAIPRPRWLQEKSLRRTSGSGAAVPTHQWLRDRSEAPGAATSTLQWLRGQPCRSPSGSEAAMPRTQWLRGSHFEAPVEAPVAPGQPFRGPKGSGGSHFEAPVAPGQPFRRPSGSGGGHFEAPVAPGQPFRSPIGSSGSDTCIFEYFGGQQAGSTPKVLSHLVRLCIY